MGAQLYAPRQSNRARCSEVTSRCTAGYSCDSKKGCSGYRYGNGAAPSRWRGSGLPRPQLSWASCTPSSYQFQAAVALRYASCALRHRSPQLHAAGADRRLEAHGLDALLLQCALDPRRDAAKGAHPRHRGRGRRCTALRFGKRAAGASQADGLLLRHRPEEVLLAHVREPRAGTARGAAGRGRRKEMRRSGESPVLVLRGRRSGIGVGCGSAWEHGCGRGSTDSCR